LCIIKCTERYFSQALEILGRTVHRLCYAAPHLEGKVDTEKLGGSAGLTNRCVDTRVVILGIRISVLINMHRKFIDKKYVTLCVQISVDAAPGGSPKSVILLGFLQTSEYYSISIPLLDAMDRLISAGAS
jgi:hypothetical protein